MQFIPKDNNYKERVIKSFARQKFMEHIQAQLGLIEPGYCEIQVLYNINITQQHAFFHAGIVGTVADNAAGYAAFSLMQNNSSVLTVEFKLNLLSPAKGELLIGKSRVLKYGKTLTVCRSDVFVVNNGLEKLCAASQSTLIELPNREDF
ncbi:MAG: PaaI family thioesterase [Sphingobacteriales bacterium]|nr:MAG: PaaI family thioesterase [Sphingobacteriales bacterium]